MVEFTRRSASQGNDGGDGEQLGRRVVPLTFQIEIGLRFSAAAKARDRRPDTHGS